MMYLKNVAGFKLDYFKGMSYDDIRLIFEAKFNLNVDFLTKEDENRALQTINETPVEKAAKRRKLNKEVEDLKIHLQIMPNEDDDVYTESTPLVRKDFENDADNDDDSSKDHDDESDDERTKSDRDEILDPNLTNVDQTEHEEENFNERVHTPLDYELTDDEKIDDEETMHDDEDDEGGADQQNASQQSGFEQEEEDSHVTLTLVLETKKTGGPTQSSYVLSNFTSKLLNLDNPSLNDTTIASLMDTIVHHEITSATTVPPPLPFFNPLQQEATPTPTLTTSEITTTLFGLPDFAYVFKFNERVTHLEKNLSEIKQVDQYAQALSFIPAIVDRYMDNKLGEAIIRAIQAYNFD
nr:hypothetical protein [Tanacetum cinerariifolium]